MASPLLIGVSSRIHHPIGQARTLGGVYTKTLHYLEQSVAHWIISRNVLVLMIPAVESEGLIKRSEMRLNGWSRIVPKMKRRRPLISRRFPTGRCW